MPSATFGADAVIRKQIFADTFTRTVSPGLGGQWFWSYYDSPFSTGAASTISVDGSAVVVPGDNNYDGYGGIPFTATGDVYFDIYTGSGGSNFGQPIYGILFDASLYRGLFAAHDSTTGWYIGYSPFNFALDNFVILNNTTWYRVHGRWTDTRLMYSIWKVVDPEPSSFQFDEALPFNFTNHDTTLGYQFLDFYFFPDVGVGGVDNVEVWTTQSTWSPKGGFTVDAVKAPAPTTSFTVNAVLKKNRSGTFTADAYITNTVSRTFSANAVLLKNRAFTKTIDANIQRGFKANAMFTRFGIARTFDAKAILAAAYVRQTHSLGDEQHANYEYDSDIILNTSIDGYPPGTTLRDYLLGIYGLISRLESFITANLYIDAIIKANLSGSAVADAVLRKAQAAALAADAVLATAPVAFTIDALLRFVHTSSATADAVLRRVQSAGITADGVFRSTLAAAITGDAVLRATRTASLLGDAILQAMQAASFTANAWVEGVNTFGFGVDAITKRTQSATADADAVLRIGRAGSFVGDSVVLRTFSGTLPANACLFRTQSGSWFVNAITQKTTTSSFSADAVIGGTDFAFDGDAFDGTAFDAQQGQAFDDLAFDGGAFDNNI